MGRVDVPTCLLTFAISLRKGLETDAPTNEKGILYEASPQVLSGLVWKEEFGFL